MPKFSVILPAYNAAWCIRDALDSIAAQTYRDYEVIVVNDGSVDNTQGIVEDCLSNNPFPSASLINQSNKGLGGARNTAIRRAKGEILTFFDADDAWFAHKLVRLAEVFDRVGPETGLLCHDELVTKHGKYLRVNRYGPSVDKMHERLLFDGNCLSPSAVAVRRDLVSKVGGFWESTSVEDYDMWLKLSKLTRFEFLHETLGECRLYDESLGSDPEHNLVNALEVINTHLADYCKSRKLGWPEHLRLMRNRGALFRGATRKAFKREEFNRVMRYAFKAIGTNPFSVRNWVNLLTLGFTQKSRQL